MASEIHNEFTLKIDFEKGSEKPENIFKAMGEMIDAFHSIDMTLIKIFDVDIHPYFILQDIEQGSIKTKLCTMLKAIDDEGLKELDWKKIIGAFLLKAKYKILEKWDETKGSVGIESIKEIEEDIHKIAEETGLNFFSNYRKLDTQRLLVSLSKVYGAASILSLREEVLFISNYGEIAINKNITISSKNIEDLLIHTRYSQRIDAILVVKKPDYLGNSMWEVQYEKKTIQGKIVDQLWLHKFKSREILLLPGDALKVRMTAEISYDDRGSVVNEHYIIFEVLDVMKALIYEQEEI